MSERQGDSSRKNKAHFLTTPNGRNSKNVISFPHFLQFIPVSCRSIFASSFIVFFRRKLSLYLQFWLVCWISSLTRHETNIDFYKQAPLLSRFKLSTLLLEYLKEAFTQQREIHSKGCRFCTMGKKQYLSITIKTSSEEAPTHRHLTWPLFYVDFWKARKDIRSACEKFGLTLNQFNE